MMEEMLKAMVRDHGLRSVSVMYLPSNANCPFTVYIHWGPVEEGNCEAFSAMTIERALEVAVSDMRETIASNTALASVEPHTEGVES